MKAQCQWHQGVEDLQNVQDISVDFNGSSIAVLSLSLSKTLEVIFQRG